MFTLILGNFCNISESILTLKSGNLVKNIQIENQTLNLLEYQKKLVQGQFFYCARPHVISPT